MKWSHVPERIQRPALLIIPSLITCALVLLPAACSRPAPAQQDSVRPVKTLVVTAGEDSRTRILPGKVEASHQVELTFQVPGLLSSLPVREGQAVSKGELIGQLRQEDFQARLATLQGQLDRARADLQASRAGVRPEERQRLEAELRSAEASLVNARSEYGRASQLLRSRTISRVEFERAETTFRVAQENAEAARQTLDQSAVGREEDVLAREGEVRSLEGRVVEANLQLSDATILAPCNGVIAQRFVEQGQNVRAKQPIVNFQNATEIDIAVDVPERVMAEIRRSDILELVAEFPAAPGLRVPVTIREIAQRADPVTQTFNVRVAMQVPEGINLLPGMSASVTMTYQRASILGNRLFVPISALFHDDAGNKIIWSLSPENTITRNVVQVGEASGDRVEILNGVQPGDRIAVAGVTFLREGMKVRDLGDALGTAQP